MKLSDVVELLGEYGYTLTIQPDSFYGGLRCIIAKEIGNEKPELDLGFYDYDYLLGIAKDFLVGVMMEERRKYGSKRFYDIRRRGLLSRLLENLSGKVQARRQKRDMVRFRSYI